VFQVRAGVGVALHEAAVLNVHWVPALDASPEQDEIRFAAV
jgi:hypothetical protein